MCANALRTSIFEREGPTGSCASRTRLVEPPQSRRIDERSAIDRRWLNIWKFAHATELPASDRVQEAADLKNSSCPWRVALLFRTAVGGKKERDR